MIQITETEHFVQFCDLAVDSKSSKKLELLINQFPSELKLIDYKIGYDGFTCIADENSTVNTLIKGLEDVPSEIHCYYRVLFLKVGSNNSVIS